MLRDRRLVFHLAVIGLPLLAVLIACKAHKLVLADPRPGAFAALGTFASDLLFALVWTAVGGAVLALFRPTGRRTMAAVVLQTLTVLAVATTLVEHVFRVKTGVILDWYMVDYALDQFHDVDKVIWSEVGLAGLAVLVVVIVCIAAPLLAERVPVMQRWLGRDKGARPRRGLMAAVAAVVGLVIVARLVAPTTDLALSRTPPAALGAQALASWFGGADDDAALSRMGAIDAVTVEAGDQVRPLNVVIVIMESVRASATTMHEPSLATTPVLARLAAEEGRLVERAYTVVPHTSKALVGVLCGFFPKVATPIVEATSGGLPGRCLPQLLSPLGYATAFFQPAEERYEARADLVRNMGFATFKGKETLAAPGFDESSYFGFEDDIMVEPALAWASAQGKPFFLAMLTLTAHHTYQVPKGFPVEAHAREGEFNDYLNTVRYTDRFVGKLVDGLKARGLWENTLLIVVGDHGEGFGEHGRFEHDAVIYEEGLRVPLVIAGGPVADKGKPIPGLRQITDILPTVMDALGYRLHGGGLPGTSMLSTPGHDKIFASCWYAQHCMARITDREKVIYHYGKRAAEVFDLVADPKERTDLAGRTDVKAAIKEMLAWRQKANWRYATQAPRSKAALVSRRADTKPQHETDITFGSPPFARLRGVDLRSPTVANGRAIEVVYHFEVLDEPDDDWQLFVHVVSDQGRMLANGDHVPAEGSHPIQNWKRGEFVTDPQSIFIRHGTPLGPAHVTIGFWRKRGGSTERAPASGSGATIDAQGRVVAATVEVLVGRR